MAPENVVRFGILGCADISRKLARAINLADNAHLHAIASRSLEKASTFAKSNGLPEDVKVYGSYSSLLDDTEIDAVYIPLPTSLHVEWACLAARKKKHILLEKPVALNVSDLDKILECCDASGVQFMDGTMWMHHPRTEKMNMFLHDKLLFGQPKSVHVCFTFAGSEDFFKNDIRVKPDLDGLGALGDMGWYTTRAILWAVGYELPKTVLAHQGPIFNEAGVLLSCGASLHWEDGKVANFHCSFLSHLTMKLTVIGTSGTLHLDDFVIPFSETEATYTAGTECRFDELVTTWVQLPSQHIVFSDIPQEVCMVQEFSRLVGLKRLNAAGATLDPSWATISRNTQLVLDAVNLSIKSGSQPVELSVVEKKGSVA